MSQPIRIQIKRSKGFSLQTQSPDGREVLCVTNPGKWGNEFRVVQVREDYYVRDSNDRVYGHNYQSKQAATAKSVREYRRWLTAKVEKGEIILSALRGKHLACFCGKSAPCHADLLLEMANA